MFLPNYNKTANYGNRLDGTPKGNGFFGPLQMQDGSNSVATEMSMSFGDQLFPLLNPYQSEANRLHLLQGKPPTEEMIDLTRQWGNSRLKQGLRPFVQENENMPGDGLNNFNNRNVPTPNPNRNINNLDEDTRKQLEREQRMLDAIMS